MRTVTVTGDALALDDLVAVARGEAGRRHGRGGGRPDGSPAAPWSADAVERDKVMYGITTGFGALADTHVGRADLERMQLALIRSHSAGVGAPLPDDVGPRPAAAAGPDPDRRLLRRAHRPARQGCSSCSTTTCCR